MVLWQDSTDVWNRQVPEAGIRKFRVQPLDCYFEEQAKRELLNSKRDDLLFYLVPADGKDLLARSLYALHLGGRCDQVIDSIKVSAVEEADFNLAAAAFGGLKYSDLSA